MLQEDATRVRTGARSDEGLERRTKQRWRGKNRNSASSLFISTTRTYTQIDSNKFSGCGRDRVGMSYESATGNATSFEIGAAA